MLKIESDEDRRVYNSSGLTECFYLSGILAYLLSEPVKWRHVEQALAVLQMPGKLINEKSQKFSDLSQEKLCTKYNKQHSNIYFNLYALFCYAWLMKGWV